MTMSKTINIEEEITMNKTITIANKMKKALMFMCLGLIVSVSAIAPVMAENDKIKNDKIKIVTVRGGSFLLNYFGGRDAGIYRKYGIDLEIDLRPFKGYAASLPTKQCMVTTYMGLSAISKINKGFDWVIIGGGLTVHQEVIVRKDSPFKTISDLRGKKFASFSTGSGAFKTMRVVVMDGFGFDVLKDTEFKQVVAPALLKLLERGDVDSMFNVSSMTFAALSQPNKFRSIYRPNDYWKKKTGHPLMWAAPIVAWRSWVNEDPDRARRFVAATHETFKWLREDENLDIAVEKYGKIAAIKNEAIKETIRKVLKEHGMFLTRWDNEVIDAQWKFLELAKKHGILKKVPDKNKIALILN